MKDEVVVSVWMITYKHEKYIGPALDSILSQKCNFKFEVVIGEDNSPDNTANIIRQYVEKYPDIIKPIFNSTNIGAMENMRTSLLACRGKYIACLEGDDFWADDNKLQKQYDLMEANPGATLCFGKSFIVNSEGVRTGELLAPIPDKERFTLADVVHDKPVFMLTATLFFRNILKDDLPVYFKNMLSGDVGLHIMLLSEGYGLYIPEEMAAYRIHPGGISSSATNKLLGTIKLYELFEKAHKYYGEKNAKIFRDGLFEMTKTMLLYGSRNKSGKERRAHIKHFRKKYFKYQPSLNLKEVMYYSMILYFPGLLKLLSGKSKSTV